MDLGRPVAISYGIRPMPPNVIKKSNEMKTATELNVQINSCTEADKSVTRPFIPCQLRVCHVFVKDGVWGTGEEAHKSHDG